MGDTGEYGWKNLNFKKLAKIDSLILPFAHRLLPIAHCPLPIAHCLLPIAYLPIVYLHL